MCCWRSWSPLPGGIWLHSLQLLMGLSGTGFLGAVKGGQRGPKGQEDKGASGKRRRKAWEKGLLKAHSGGLCVLMHLKEKQYKALCTMPCGSVCVCQIIMVITIFLLEEDCSYSKTMSWFRLIVFLAWGFNCSSSLGFLFLLLVACSFHHFFLSPF